MITPYENPTHPSWRRDFEELELVELLDGLGVLSHQDHDDPWLRSMSDEDVTAALSAGRQLAALLAQWG